MSKEIETLSIGSPESRAALADRIEAIAQEHGCRIQRTVEGADALTLCAVAQGGLELELTLDARNAKAPHDVTVNWKVQGDTVLSHEEFPATVDVKAGAKTAHRWCRGETALLTAVRAGLASAVNGSAYADLTQPMCYIVNVSHQNREQRYVTVWRPGNAGYAYPLSWAGKYALDKVRARQGYYNNGENLAVPCHVLDAMAIPPARGDIDNNAGPVVLNSMENWHKLLSSVIAVPPGPLTPVCEDSPGSQSSSYEIPRSEWQAAIAALQAGEELAMAA